MQSDWVHLSDDRLQTLRTQYGVSWVLLENSTPLDGVVCPYSNGQMRVCRIVDQHRQLLSRSRLVRVATIARFRNECPSPPP